MNARSVEKNIGSTREELGSNSLIMDLQSSRHKRWIRAIAITLVVTFINQDIIWAQDGAPIWSKGQNGSLSFKPPVNVNSPINVPKDVAVTKEVYTAPGDRTIINIQDAHSSLGAQESIASVLDSLVTNYDLKLVAVEGSSGYIDTSILRAFSNENIRKGTASYLVKEGRMSAGEFFAVTSNKPIALYGIEDKPLYQENLEQFRAVYRANGAIRADIEKLLSSLKGLQNKIYSRELKDLTTNSVLHKNGKLTFTERWNLVKGLAAKTGADYKRYENLTRLVESLKLEKDISFEKANKERDSLIDALSKKATKQGLEQLVLKSLSYKTGKLSNSEYYVFLQEQAERARIDAAPYGNLIAYTDYITLYESIDLTAIFEEARDFEDQIKEKLFQNEYQKRLYYITKCMGFLSDLFDLKLTNGDFSYLSENIGRCNAEFVASFIRDASMKYGVTINADYDLGKIFNDLPQALDFYRTAEERNNAILANTIATMKERGQNVAALITGGYHSQGITELLRQNRTSYIVILPKFDVSKGERPYVAILTNKTAPYERLLKGGQYFIATSAYLAGVSQLNQDVDNRIAAGEDFKAVLNSPEFKELKAKLADSLIASLLQSATGVADVAEAVRLFKSAMGNEGKEPRTKRDLAGAVGQYLKDYEMLIEREGSEFRAARVKPLTPEILKELVRDVVLDYAGFDILAEEPAGPEVSAVERIPAAVEERIQVLSARISALEEKEKIAKIDAIVELVTSKIDTEALDWEEGVAAVVAIELRRKGLGAEEQQALTDRIIDGIIKEQAPPVAVPVKTPAVAMVPVVEPAPAAMEPVIQPTQLTEAERIRLEDILTSDAFLGRLHDEIAKGRDEGKAVSYNAVIMDLLADEGFGSNVILGDPEAKDVVVKEIIKLIQEVEARKRWLDSVNKTAEQVFNLFIVTMQRRTGTTEESVMDSIIPKGGVVLHLAGGDHARTDFLQNETSKRNATLLGLDVTYLPADGKKGLFQGDITKDNSRNIADSSVDTIISISFFNEECYDLYEVKRKLLAGQTPLPEDKYYSSIAKEIRRMLKDGGKLYTINPIASPLFKEAFEAESFNVMNLSRGEDAGLYEITKTAKPGQEKKASAGLSAELHRKIAPNAGFIKMALLFALSLYMLILSVIPSMAAPVKILPVAPRMDQAQSMPAPVTVVPPVKAAPSAQPAVSASAEAAKRSSLDQEKLRGAIDGYFKEMTSHSYFMNIASNLRAGEDPLLLDASIDRGKFVLGSVRYGDDTKFMPETRIERVNKIIDETWETVDKASLPQYIRSKAMPDKKTGQLTPVDDLQKALFALSVLDPATYRYLEDNNVRITLVWTDWFAGATKGDDFFGMIARDPRGAKIALREQNDTISKVWVLVHEAVHHKKGAIAGGYAELYFNMLGYVKELFVIDGLPSYEVDTFNAERKFFRDTLRIDASLESLNAA
ncbi:MAG: hypothetical protein ABH875_01365, partial [Candidatus Omnitrophota bacterium]